MRLLPAFLLCSLVLTGCSLDVADPVGDPDVPGAGGPGETGDPGAKPGVVPWRHNGFFGAESPFRQSVSGPVRLDPHSDDHVALLAASGEAALEVSRRSVAVYATDSNTTFRGTVELECAEAWGIPASFLESVGVPPFAEPTAGDGAAPECGEGPGRLEHMTVIDGPQRCLYDFWRPRKEGPLWRASWVAAVPVDGSGFHEGGLGVRASGAALAAGVIWPQELDAGRIGHALAFTYGHIRPGGPVPPATNGIVGGTSDHPWALPMGAVLRLDPALDPDTLGLDRHELVIARALQEHGMILVDSREEGVGLFAVDPVSVTGDPYHNTLPPGEEVTLDNLPLEHLQVLELPEQDGAWQSRLRLPDNRCADYR